jgi:(R,R)-butanediol dehydrogenase/meso-butanediol dehydrogenase/diacetyl reductase
VRAAVLVDNGRFEVQEVPTPVPTGNQVLIRVSYCGICGSDLHALRAGSLTPGRILGHEIAGVVEAVGPKVRGLEAGDRVTTLSAVPCDHCEKCEAGLYRSCRNGWQIYGYGTVPGGYAEFAISHSSIIEKAPDGLSEVAAALNEPAMVGMHAARVARLNPGDTAVVIGAGPIGLLTMQAARVAGAGAVYVMEMSAGRRKMAAELGATRVFDPRTEDIAAFLRDTTEAGPEVVFECAGARGTLQRAVELVRPGGQVVLAGVNADEDEISPLTLVAKECEIKASLGGGDIFRRTLDLIAAGKLRTEPMVTRIIGLDEVDAMMQELGTPGCDDVNVLVAPGR